MTSWSSSFTSIILIPKCEKYAINQLKNTLWILVVLPTSDQTFHTIANESGRTNYLVSFFSTSYKCPSSCSTCHAFVFNFATYHLEYWHSIISCIFNISLHKCLNWSTTYLHFFELLEWLDQVWSRKNLHNHPWACLRMSWMRRLMNTQSSCL